MTNLYNGSEQMQSLGRVFVCSGSTPSTYRDRARIDGARVGRVWSRIGFRAAVMVGPDFAYRTISVTGIVNRVDA